MGSTTLWDTERGILPGSLRRSEPGRPASLRYERLGDRVPELLEAAQRRVALARVELVDRSQLGQRNLLAEFLDQHVAGLAQSAAQWPTVVAIVQAHIAAGLGSDMPLFDHSVIKGVDGAEG